MLFINLSLLGCSCLSGAEKKSVDVRVWVIDGETEGAFGQTRFDEDKGEYKSCSEMDNYICFSPLEFQEFLRR
jgi:hypothetical protein